jgi:hypothetical protein
MRTDLERAKGALEISDRIKPLLAGKGADVQGAVLADLLSIWLAGHPAEMREEILAMHIEYVCQLVPASEAEMREMQNEYRNGSR